MLRRWLEPLLNAQAVWADPLGDLFQRIFRALYGPFPALRDLLHGTWLGHPLHPMLTDVPIGALIIATILDVVGQPDAAAWAIGVGIVSMLGAALAGYADYLDLEGTGKRVGSLHSTSMLVALVFYVISLGARVGWWPLFQGGEEWTAIIGLLFVTVMFNDISRNMQNIVKLLGRLFGRSG